MNTLKDIATVTSNKNGFTDHNCLFFKKKGLFQKVKINEITFIQADDDYSISYTKEGKFLSTLRLKDLEELLVHHGFFRTHRSYLVNLSEATSIDIDNNILNISGQSIPFSRRIKAQLIKQLPLI